MDPLAGTPWSAPATVEGFVKGSPNRVLIDYARHLLAGRLGARAVDIGCGAGRNAVPLAEQGWRVLGTDFSWPMVFAARSRIASGEGAGRLDVVLAPMDALPVRDGSADLIVAHGIWNLSKSAGEFRRAVGEASRVAREDAALFVFTFSRHTLAADATPVAGETFVFTQFAGQPQVFLTDTELVSEMRAFGFVPDPAIPLTEYNRPSVSAVRASGTGPVIYEAAFRRRRSA